METTTNDFRKDMGQIKDSVKKGANSIRQSVEDQIDSTDWKARYEDLRERAGEAVDASEDFIKAHPYYTLLGVAAAGFVAGMLMRRK